MESADAHIDRELILLVSSGDIAAFRKLYDIYRNKIYSIAFKFTSVQTAAEDIVQDVFIKLWLNKERLPDVENFNAYFNAIARNHIFNYLRKIAHEETLLQNLATNQIVKDKDTFDNLSYHELQGFLNKAVEQLSPQQKRVFMFSRIDGLKHKEIAEKMSISQSTVKGHMVEALSQIKRFLISREDLLFLILIFLQ